MRQVHGQTDLIAQYAAALGDNAVNRYALFLAELPVSAYPHERRDALFRAEEFGLDVTQVALSTADMCMERAFKVRTSRHLRNVAQCRSILCLAGSSELASAISACVV